MPGHRVDGLGLAAVPGRYPGVEQDPGPGDLRGVGRVEHRQVARTDGEVSAYRGRRTRLDGPLAGPPRGEAAVQYPYRWMSRPAQRPPEPGRGLAVPGVVGDHRPVPTDPGRPQRLLQRRRIRQRVP